jgi:hypothetical protein
MLQILLIIASYTLIHIKILLPSQAAEASLSLIHMKFFISLEYSLIIFFLYPTVAQATLSYRNAADEIQYMFDCVQFYMLDISCSLVSMFLINLQGLVSMGFLLLES